MMDVSERFWSKVRKGENECIEWIGSIGSDGYGKFRLNGKIEGAHRVAFFLSNGRWPNSHVLHSCDNPICCFSEHLSEGSHQENIKQCAERKRNRSPRPGNGFDRLGNDGRDAIRRLYASGFKNKSAIGRMFGVSPTRVRQVVNG
jgi:hypothetical protein